MTTDEVIVGKRDAVIDATMLEMRQHIEAHTQGLLSQDEFLTQGINNLLHARQILSELDTAELKIRNVVKEFLDIACLSNLPIKHFVYQLSEIEAEHPDTFLEILDQLVSDTTNLLDTLKTYPIKRRKSNE